MSLAPTKIDNFVALSEAWGMRALAWNPLTGCTGKDCAIGVKNCWAARRQKSFAPTYWPSRAEKVLHIRKSSIIVCNYLGESFVDRWRFVETANGGYGCCNKYAVDEVLKYQRQASQHTYFWLSKHPELYDKFDWPDGTWLGTTLNKPIKIGDKITPLFRVEANIKTYLYIEPILTKDWTGIFQKAFLKWGLGVYNLDWVIIGGKSRGTLPGVKIHKESVAAVVATCELLGIPVFCKNNLKPVFKAEFDSLPREVPMQNAKRKTKGERDGKILDYRDKV